MPKASKQPPKPISTITKRQVADQNGKVAWHRVYPTRFQNPNPHATGPTAGGPVPSR